MSENKRLFVGRKKVEDKFTIISDYDDEIGVKENQSGDVVVLKHNDLNAQQFVAQLVVFLNDQNQAIVDLYEGCEYWSDKASERITLLEKENEQLKETINEVKTDEKQLSISFMGYKMQLIEVLQQNYNYAYSQRQKNLDKSIVAKTYEVLAQTVCNIAETMNVDIERFPRDGDSE